MIAHTDHLDYQTCRNLSVANWQRPMLLELSEGMKTINCQECLRVLPGKRIIFKGEWQGKQVAIKVFYTPRHHHQYALRELHGLSALESNGFECPTVLYQGTCFMGGKGSVIVTEWIDSPRLGEYWENLSTLEEKRDTLSSVIKLFLNLFNHRLSYYDCHLNNFLVRAGTLILLDGDTVRIHAKPLSTNHQIKSLARCLAQFPHLDDATYHRIFEKTPFNYIQDCQEYHLQQRQRRVRKFLRKCCRNATQFVQLSAPFKSAMVIRNRLTPTLKSWMQNPDAIFEKSHKLKDGNSSTVIRCQFAEVDVVIKRYNLKNFWHRIRRIFRHTRAHHAWVNTHHLHCVGIRTVDPIAYLEYRFLGLHGVSYFVYDHKDGERADVVMTNPSLSDDRRNKLIVEFTKILGQLKRAQLSHGDLKASNFLIADDDTVSLIDVDSLQFHSTTAQFSRHHERDIKRFLQNWQAHHNLHSLFTQALAEI